MAYGRAQNIHCRFGARCRNHRIQLYTCADDNLAGTIYKYRFEVSMDGSHWKTCATSEEFSNIMHNPVTCFVHFEQSYRGRFFRLVPLAEISGKPCTSIAEIGIFAVALPAKDDESAVYPVPGAPLTLKLGMRIRRWMDGVFSQHMNFWSGIPVMDCRWDSSNIEASI